MQTTHQNQSRPFPGLACESLEFFEHNGEVKAFKKGKMIGFDELPFAHHEIITRAINVEPDAYEILKEWHPESELKQRRTFIKCRFGGLDHNPDIKNMELQYGEWWDCPFRGSCKGEGVVCRHLSYNNHIINAKEIKLLRLMATAITNEALAEELELPMGTFNLFKKELYAKLAIQTKQEATVIAVHLNLI